jgi:hypothetical protein
LPTTSTPSQPDEVFRPTFNFHAAFDETCDGTVWGVWVGEHGFLKAVFTEKKDAYGFVEDLPHSDWQIDSIKLYDT